MNIYWVPGTLLRARNTRLGKARPSFKKSHGSGNMGNGPGYYKKVRQKQN